MNTIFKFMLSEAARLANTIVLGKNRITDEQFILNEIKKFTQSQKRQAMFDGERYFDGKHDILSRERTVLGKDGILEVVHNLPNNRIVDNQYKKMVVQKTNHLLGHPVTIQRKCPVLFI